MNECLQDVQNNKWFANTVREALTTEKPSCHNAMNSADVLYDNLEYL